MPVPNDVSPFYRPCLVLAHGDPSSAADLCRRFRRAGWDVYQTHGGPEARRLVRMLDADLAILEANLTGESGFLTCAKLIRERTGARVVLVSEDVGPRSQALAGFVGAAELVRLRDCLPAQVKSSGLPPMSAAG